MDVRAVSRGNAGRYSLNKGIDAHPRKSRMYFRFAVRKKLLLLSLDLESRKKKAPGSPAVKKIKIIIPPKYLQVKMSIYLPGDCGSSCCHLDHRGQGEEEV